MPRHAAAPKPRIVDVDLGLLDEYVERNVEVDRAGATLQHGRERLAPYNSKVGG